MANYLNSDKFVGSIIIPILQPDWKDQDFTIFTQSLEAYGWKVIIIDSGDYRVPPGLSSVLHVNIDKSEFSHGGTRNLGARLASEQGAEILVFMTQDALPARPDWLDHLMAPIRSGEAVATFARQLPRPGASVLEEFSRYFNYPTRGSLRTCADIPEMGVKAFFFSNVCSAVRADVFWELGGFPDNVIMNEDMLLAAKVIRAGYAIKYVSEAEVVHSHDYSLKQQFRRNFDVGAFFADAGGMLEGAAVGGEGFRFVREQLLYVLRRGRPDLLPLVVLEAVVKFSAFQLGKLHRFLPLSAKKRMSMHSYHWDQK